MNRHREWPPAHTASTRVPLTEEAGSGLIEVALVAPVFFMLFFGFINFALILFQYCGITYASRAAMRYACLHSNTSYVPMSNATLNSIVSPFLFSYPANTPTVTLIYTTTNTVGSTLTVNIKLVYNLTLPGYTLNGLKIANAASGVIMQ